MSEERMPLLKLRRVSPLKLTVWRRGRDISRWAQAQYPEMSLSVYPLSSSKDRFLVCNYIKQ